MLFLWQLLAGCGASLRADIHTCTPVRGWQLDAAYANVALFTLRLPSICCQCAAATQQLFA